MSAEPVSAPSLASADDEVLMARFAAGEPRAFEVLYARYEAPVYGFCLRFLSDPDLAEDAFQDAMIRVVEQSVAYRPRGRFRSWLFTIARSACVDRVRRRTRRGKLVSAITAGFERKTPSTERSIELREEIARLLSKLPAGQREVLLLHRYEGFSYAEIARMTGSTESAVKQKAYRALLALRAES